MADVKTLQKVLKKKLSKDNLSTSKSLSIILTELHKQGKLQSCVLTDITGLVMAEVLHKRDTKESLAAVSSLVTGTAERLNDYLKISPVNLSFFYSNTSLIWVLSIKLSGCEDEYILVCTKAKTILENMSNAALNVLDRERSDLVPMMKIAASWIAKICK